MRALPSRVVRPIAPFHTDALPDGPMRPSRIEGLPVLLDQPAHLSLVQNHEVVETLPP